MHEKSITFLNKTVADEEDHYDQFGMEHEKLRQYGDNYLALQSMESSKARISGGTE